MRKTCIGCSKEFEPNLPQIETCYKCLFEQSKEDIAELKELNEMRLDIKDKYITSMNKIWEENSEYIKRLSSNFSNSQHNNIVLSNLIKNIRLQIAVLDCKKCRDQLKKYDL